VPHQHPHASGADEEHVRRELELLARELRKDGIAAEAQVRRAKPGVAIIDAVREYDATVIVRSSYEGHDLAGWLRGTIIDEVMHQIQIPVLIIPTVEVPAPAPGLRLRVLVPLDGSALAESALVQVLEIARPRSLDVRLVAVVHRRLGPLGALLPSVPNLKTERRATTRYLHNLAATLRAEGVVTHTDVIEIQDSVGRVLFDLAHRSVVDVVVMTTRGLNTPTTVAWAWSRLKYSSAVRSRCCWFPALRRWSPPAMPGSMAGRPSQRQCNLESADVCLCPGRR
jgi:nucleotide-binding universal stress UspA family protein